MMVKRFKVGNDVTWNSEAGVVSGTIIKVHPKNVDYKGYSHHASENDPQYKIKSSKTEHTRAHDPIASTLSAAGDGISMNEWLPAQEGIVTPQTSGRTSAHER